MHPIPEHTAKVLSEEQKLAKRILLASAAFVEFVSHYILTNARYLGQGLDPQFFRMSTRSDIISNVLFLFIIFLFLRAIWDPSRMSYMRTFIVVILGFIIFWITLGAKNFEIGEFPHIASITYLIMRTSFIALLFPRREYNFSRLSGAVKVIQNTTIIFASSIIFTFIFSFTYAVTSDFEELRKYDADAVVILGAAVWHGAEKGDRPSPTFLERIKLGSRLVQTNVTPKIVTTGANAPGERSEGEIAKMALVSAGIDESKITSESNSHSTLEQILYLRNELAKTQGWEKFIIISDQYHLARAIEMCKFNGIDAIGAPSGIRQSVFDLAYYRLRESVALMSYWILGK
jgi:uncharacterized SAM-binding protein YcdF (DUF218 family)